MPSNCSFVHSFLIYFPDERGKYLGLMFQQRKKEDFSRNVLKRVSDIELFLWLQ